MTTLRKVYALSVHEKSVQKLGISYLPNYSYCLVIDDNKYVSKNYECITYSLLPQIKVFQT